VFRCVVYGLANYFILKQQYSMMCGLVV